MRSLKISQNMLHFQDPTVAAEHELCWVKIEVTQGFEGVFCADKHFVFGSNHMWAKDEPGGAK